VENCLPYGNGVQACRVVCTVSSVCAPAYRVMAGSASRWPTDTASTPLTHGPRKPKGTT
jgi:hypothetical protein